MTYFFVPCNIHQRQASLLPYAGCEAFSAWRKIIRSLTVVIYCNHRALQPLLKRQLEDEYRLLFSDTFESLSKLLKKHEIACIVAHPFHDGECRLWEIRGLKERFELIPLNHHLSM